MNKKKLLKFKRYEEKIKRLTPSCDNCLKIRDYCELWDPKLIEEDRMKYILSPESKGDVEKERILCLIHRARNFQMGFGKDQFDIDKTNGLFPIAMDIFWSKYRGYRRKLKEESNGNK